MKFVHLGMFAVVSALPLATNAQVTVEHPWVRATAPGQVVAGVYLKITSAKSAALVGARSPVCKDAEIHEMTMNDGIMKMRPVPRVVLPAGKPVEMKPGGYHLMLVNLARPLREGETVPVTLVIEDRGGKRRNVEFKAEVRGLAAAAGSHQPMNHTQ